MALKKLDVEKRALNAKFKQRSADLNTITAKAAEAGTVKRKYRTFSYRNPVYTCTGFR